MRIKRAGNSDDPIRLTRAKICEDGIREKLMENPLKLKRIHHVEFWVGNARQAAYFYRKGFGFSQVAYSGLETGQRQRTSYALSQGKANFVLTTPNPPEGAPRAPIHNCAH